MRRFAPLLPLPLLLAVAAFFSASAADAAGAALGRGLAAFAGFLAAPPHESPHDAEAPVERVAHVPASTLSALSEPPTGKGHKARRAPSKPAPRAIFVSAKAVLALSEARVMPRGTRVPARGKRPAGIRLSGVEALGIGLREGDVLTRALGRPALSTSEVVKAVLLARTRRVKILEGEFYRGEERWVLRVEQPYLDDPRGGLTESATGPRLPTP